MNNYNPADRFAALPKSSWSQVKATFQLGESYSLVCGKVVLWLTGVLVVHVLTFGTRQLSRRYFFVIIPLKLVIRFIEVLIYSIGLSV